MILGGGCVSRPTPTETSPAALTPQQQQLLEDLRLATDRLMSVVATADGPRIREFFPPQADVQVGRQLQYYLDVPLQRLRIINWDGQTVIAERLDDDRVMTALRLEIQHGREPPRNIAVVFFWQRDPQSGRFYLVPLREPVPKPITDRSWPAVPA